MQDVFDMPWINWEKYSVPEVIFFITGSVLWIIAYSAMLRNDYKNKTLSIPIINVCLNFTWEIMCAFVFFPDMGLILVIGYWLWFVMDLFIVISMFRFGRTQVRNPFLLKVYYPMLIIGLIGSFAIQWFWMAGGGPGPLDGWEYPMSPVSAYTINLVMSVCYIGLLFIPNFKGNLKIVGWTKGLGTGLISVMFYLHYSDLSAPKNAYLFVLYILCAFFDAVYIYLLYKPKLLKANELDS